MAQQAALRARLEQLRRDAPRKVASPASDLGVTARQMAADPVAYPPVSLPAVRARQSCLTARLDESELLPEPQGQQDAVERVPQDAAPRMAPLQ
jgi:hypothetical protein